MGWHLGFSLLTTLWTRPNSSGGIGAREMDACFLMAAGWREGREGETYWTCGRCRARRLVDGTDEWRRGPTKRRNKRTVLYVLFLLAEPYTCRRVLPLLSRLLWSPRRTVFFFLDSQGTKRDEAKRDTRRCIDSVNSPIVPFLPHPNSLRFSRKRKST